MMTIAESPGRRVSQTATLRTTAWSTASSELIAAHVVLDPGLDHLRGHRVEHANRGKMSAENLKVK
jgi:hypothetical protein